MIHLSPEWSSQSQGHRLALRRSILKCIPSFVSEEEILNLDIIPKTLSGALSISHCQELGGWVFEPEAKRIGFDLELIRRTPKHLVAKVSTQQELEGAPNPTALWTAKEACYKVLPLEAQPLTAKEIQIFAWVKTRDGFEFQGRHTHEKKEFLLRGSTWAIGEHTLASLCR